MKKILLFIAAIFAVGALNAQVIIKGVFDGPLSGGAPKFVELFAVTTTDLTGYALRNHNNGATGFTNSTDISSLGTLNAGEYAYVIVTGQDDEFRTYFGLSMTDFDALNTVTGAAPNVNGDDAISLFDGTNNVDVFGVIGTDGTGEAWEYLDGWAYKNNNTNNAFSPSDWTFSGVNATDGCTTNATCSSMFPSGNSVLPIELTYFNATATANNQVALEWRTESEENNDYMAVERSQDGQKFFEIGKVKGAGTTIEAQEYSFVDAAPKAGVNYYRLKQVDFDGTMEYHKVVAVSIKGASSTSVYPTLASEVVNVNLEGTATLTVRNVAGAVVKQVKATDFATLNVADLAAGTYFLLVETDSNVETVRFVKQ